MNVESTYGSSQSQTRGGNLTDAVVDTMVRWPMRVTGATMDLMLQGMQRMAGATRDGIGTNGSNGTHQDAAASTSSSGSSTGSSSGSSWSSLFSTSNSAVIDQDLSGTDLKYVIWSIVFTKPGYECILQRQQEELVSYPADANTYAAVKIAQFLDGARHGHAEKPAAWADRYPADSSKSRSGRDETTVITTPESTVAAVSSASTSAHTNGSGGDRDKGWRIPPEDQKYITFLFKVDRRLARQEEVTRVDRVTVERGTRVV